MKTTKTFMLIIVVLLWHWTVYSQEDKTVQQLRDVATQLNKEGDEGMGGFFMALSDFFDLTSEKTYNADLAKVMTSLNLPNGVYAIDGGSITAVPEGYLKQGGKWFPLSALKNGALMMILDGKLYDVPTTWLMYYNGEQWYKLETEKQKMSKPFVLNNGQLEIVNDGWYTENGAWKQAGNVNQQSENRYMHFKDEPEGLFAFSGWTDTNQDGIKEKTELTGLNQPEYNIAKENLCIDLNIPNIGDNVVFTSWRDGQLIGTSVRNLKAIGRDYFNAIGPGNDPSATMDFLDRIALDVKKNGAGTYQIIVSNPDKDFNAFEMTVKVKYEP